MHEWKEARFKADSTFVGFASLDECANLDLVRVNYVADFSVF